MTLENWLSKIIKSRGINLSEMARLIGVPYMALYDSFMNRSRGREIRGWELVRVCKFLDVDLREFADKEKRGDGNEKEGNSGKTGQDD